jgi:peptidoglycan/LPS O-acetylase OafA/YrhL
MQKENRILQLDGLRGIAVLLVICFHFLNNQYSNVTGLSRIEKAISKVAYFGWCGVDLFFVLSGFLIGSILLKNRGKENYFKAFYVRRFFRIIPIYYLLLLCFIALKYTPIYSPDAYIFEKDIPIGYYFLFLQNFVMGARNHFGPEAITPTWSLAVEEQFYLITPLIVYWIKPKYLVWVILFMIALAPACRSLCANWYQKYTLLSSRIDSPAFGFLLAWLLYNEKTNAFIRKQIGTIRWIAIPFLILSTGLYASSLAGVFNHSILAINFALIILIALFLEKGILYRILTSKALVITGGLSYFIYLFHQTINGVFHIVFLHQKFPVLNGAPSYIVTLGTLITVFVFARLSYKYLEQPQIRFSHSFAY